MKKVAFTCSRCGVLNVPATGDHWRGFAPCSECGSMESVATTGTEKTAGGLYRVVSQRSGLSVTTLIELQKRGLLPRDLAGCTQEHRIVIGAVALAVSSEEILRSALARLPKKRREKLVPAVAEDGLLTRWQRDVVDRYVKEYERELRDAPPRAPKGGKRYGSKVTTIPAMILYLEKRYKISAATSRNWIRELKKRAYNRVRRSVKAKEGANA